MSRSTLIIKWKTQKYKLLPVVQSTALAQEKEPGMEETGMNGEKCL